MEQMRHIYVMENQDGDVKIGVSGNVKKRAKVISCQTGYTIERVYKTKKCSNPIRVETLAHKHFEDRRIFGEWFSVSFNEAVEVVSSLFESNAEFKERVIPEIDFSSIFTKYTVEPEPDCTAEYLGQAIKTAFDLFETANKVTDKYEKLIERNKELIKQNRELKEIINIIAIMLGGDDSPIIKELVKRALRVIKNYEPSEELKEEINKINIQMN